MDKMKILLESSQSTKQVHIFYLFVHVFPDSHKPLDLSLENGTDEIKENEISSLSCYSKI